MTCTQLLDTVAEILTDDPDALEAFARVRPLAVAGYSALLDVGTLYWLDLEYSEFDRFQLIVTFVKLLDRDLRKSRTPSPLYLPLGFHGQERASATLTEITIATSVNSERVGRRLIEAVKKLVTGPTPPWVDFP